MKQVGLERGKRVDAAGGGPTNGSCNLILSRGHVLPVEGEEGGGLD